MDKATTTKTRVAFARICVRIKAGDELPTSITITDNYGADTNQEVHYEWIPPQCIKCKSFGHNCVDDVFSHSGKSHPDNLGLMGKNEFHVSISNGAENRMEQQIKFDKNFEWRQRQSRKWVKVEPTKNAKPKVVDDEYKVSSPTATANKFEALLDITEDMGLGDKQKLTFSTKQQMSLIAE